MCCPLVHQCLWTKEVIVRVDWHESYAATEGQQHDNLRLSRKQVNHKVYPNAQHEGLCNGLVVTAGNHQECLCYHWKTEKRDCCRSKNIQIGHCADTVEKRLLVSVPCPPLWWQDQNMVQAAWIHEPVLPIDNASSGWWWNNDLGNVSLGCAWSLNTTGNALKTFAKFWKSDYRILFWCFSIYTIIFKQHTLFLKY